MAADQRAGRDQPAQQRVVARIHCVLRRVRQEQQQHQVSGRALPGLALAGRAQKDQQKNTNHHAVQHEFPPRSGESAHGLLPLQPVASMATRKKKK